MMLILFNMSLMLSSIFIFMKHPLSMGVVLLMKTIVISLITGILNYNFWYSYILFLIMIGGMLVLFIYMTSVASNEKFKFSMNMLILIFSISMISVILTFTLDSNYFSYSNLLTNWNFNEFNLSLNKFLIFPSSIVLMMMMIYLFITLVAVVKITNIKMGPLRQVSH